MRQDHERYELLVPERLQELLMVEFKGYLDSRKPNFLQNSDPQPEEVEPTRSISQLVGSACRYFKSITAEVVEQASRTHATLIKFFTDEMADIMSQNVDPLTKMTNLMILFYGLYSYILMRNSKDLCPRLDKIDRKLWLGFPKSDRRVNQELKALIENNLGKRFHKPYTLGYDKAEILERLVELTSQAQDRREFIIKFNNEIMVAHSLMSINVNLISNNLSKNEADSNKDVLPTLLSIRNAYRCPERNMLEFCYSFSAQETEREAAKGITPSADMGSTYNAFLKDIYTRQLADLVFS
jgi:hypothetical protein